MKIKIQTPEGFNQGRVTAFIRENLSKMEKLYPVVEANVCLKSERDIAGRNCICEIKLAIPGNDLFAAKREESFDAAAHATLDALKRQIDRLRTNWEKDRIASN